MDPSVACVTLDGGLGNPTGAGAYTTRVFCGGGPGLVSMSPDSIRRLRIQAEWEVEGFRFRAELFLMLLGSEWNGCGEVRARLTCGREKSAVWLFFGWIRTGFHLALASNEGG